MTFEWKETNRYDLVKSGKAYVVEQYKRLDDGHVSATTLYTGNTPIVTIYFRYHEDTFSFDESIRFHYLWNSDNTIRRYRRKFFLEEELYAFTDINTCKQAIKDGIFEEYKITYGI